VRPDPDRSVEEREPLEPSATSAGPPPELDAPTICDVCGSRDLLDVRCKVVCRNCKTVLQTCSDL
jgi:hypothetical protein